MVSVSTPRWGDDIDDSDDEEQLTSVPGRKLTIPPTHKSRVDSQGIQIVTSYRAHPSNPHQLFKTVTKCKIETVKVKEPRDVEKRRQWKPFGQAALDLKAGVQTTVQSKEEIVLENPHADTDLQDQDPGAAIAGNLNAFWAKQQRRQLERKYDVGATPAPGVGEDSGWTQVGKLAGAATGAATTGKYLTPAQRAGLASIDPSGAAGGTSTFRRTDDLNTLRVTNLSANTTESDIQELFSNFGRISRVYLAKDKETMESRGFAFVSFVNKEDAARAMEGLQGYGTYDSQNHVIVRHESVSHAAVPPRFRLRSFDPQDRIRAPQCQGPQRRHGVPIRVRKSLGAGHDRKGILCFQSYQVASWTGMDVFPARRSDCRLVALLVTLCCSRRFVRIVV